MFIKSIHPNIRNKRLNLFRTLKFEENMTVQTIKEIYSKFVECNYVVSTDSRNILPNSLFICLKGEKFDGNQFANEAFEKGAQYVVTENSSVLNQNMILVSDSNEILPKLAQYHATQIQTKLIAIGGSNGKTTTKEICQRVLEHDFNTKCTQANFNNHIGVPLTLLSLKPDVDIGIIELGTNHPGEMKFLCDLFNPVAGVITNIGKEHLEGFGNIEAVAKEESEVYLQLQKSNGLALVNLDDHWLSNMSNRLTTKQSYSLTNRSANLFAEIICEMPYLNFKLYHNQVEIGVFEAQIGGKHNLYNLMVGILFGISFGIDPFQASLSACEYKPTNNRSEWISYEKHEVLLDAYNANPSSVEAGLKSFSSLEGQKAVLLGDMLELGNSASTEHLAIFNLCQELKFDEIYVCGEHFMEAVGQFPMKFKSADSLLAWLDTHPIQSKYVYIKGSRGIKMEKCLEHFKTNESFN